MTGDWNKHTHSDNTRNSRPNYTRRDNIIADDDRM